MAALFGLAMLGQVACASYIDCAEGYEPEAAPADAPAEEPPAVTFESCGQPLCSSLGYRIYCIEGYESGHYGGALNPRSGARGWLQWLPSTARAYGVVIGDRRSEWTTAAWIHDTYGERFFRSQWTPMQLGYCL